MQSISPPVVVRPREAQGAQTGGICPLQGAGVALRSFVRSTSELHARTTPNV
jgi:hypothetical protein